MATGKRYYWIKLRESFMTSDTVDFLMSQKDGASYVVLYQMLCLKTINTGGRLSRQIGEYLIPYDVEKIQRDCKWFSVDTIRVALNLYKGFGLIYEDVDGTLVLAEHESMVGTETDWSEKKRRQRALPPSGDNVPTLVPSDVPQNVPIDIRDKRLDIRNKRIDTDNGDKDSISNTNNREDNQNTKRKNTSCSERSNDPSKQKPEVPAIFQLESNTGDFYNVTQTEIDYYKKLYPAVDVEQEYRKMIGWIGSHRTNRKTLKGMPIFINSWLAKEQDNGGKKGGGQSAVNQGGSDEQSGTGWSGEGLL